MMRAGFLFSGLCALLTISSGCRKLEETDSPTVQQLLDKRFSPEYQFPHDTLVGQYLLIVSEYSAVKEALVDGNSPQAKVAAKKLQAAVETFLDHSPRDTTAESETLRKHGNELRLTSLAIQQSGLLHEQRQHFYGMSQYLQRFVQDFGTGGLTMRQYSNASALSGHPAYWFETDSLPDDPYGSPNGSVASLQGIYFSER